MIRVILPNWFRKSIQLFHKQPQRLAKVKYDYSSTPHKTPISQIVKQGGVIPEIKKPNQTAQQVIDSPERDMSREQLSSELKARLSQLKIKHDLLRIQIRKKVDLPFQLCGINRKTYHESFAYMPDRVMSYYRIHETTINNYLLKIYKASLYSIIDNNTAFMNQYWEEGLKNKVVSSLQTHKEKGFSIKLNQDKKYVTQTEETCKIVDAIMLRGLSINRQHNQHPSSYKRYEEDAEMGLTTFTPLHLIQNNERFINPEENKKVYEGYDKMILRVAVLVKSPLRFEVQGIEVPEQLNTFEHLLVFENEMIAPKPLESRYKIETLMEWMGKYRFGIWKLVDIDNFMGGNSPFRLHENQEPLDEIFENTNIDRSYFCNIRRV